MPPTLFPWALGNTERASEQISQMFTRQAGLHEIDERGPLLISGEHRLADEEEASKQPECRGSHKENFGKQLLEGQTRVTLLTLKCQRKRLATTTTHGSLIQCEHVVGGKRGRTWTEWVRAGPLPGQRQSGQAS